MATVDMKKVFTYFLMQGIIGLETQEGKICRISSIQASMEQEKR